LNVDREEIQIKVPFIDLKRFEPGFQDALREKFGSMAANAQFIGGAEVAKFEARLQEAVTVKHAVTCANGTDALQLALRSLGVGRGDIVLVPDVTFWATFEAVVNVGADPVTVDADLADGGVSFAALAEGIDRFQPKAVIIAHLYGWGSQRLADIRALCAERNVLLLEDGAQSYGAEYRGKPIYAGALIATTSFYPAKVLGGAGDGGAVFTDNAELADRVRRLGNHGRTTHYGYGDVGWNSRLDSLQAAFLNLSLDYIDHRIASRRRSAARYRDGLSGLGVEIMSPPSDYFENGYCNVCLLRDPERKIALEAALKAADVGFGNIYPGVMSQQPGAKGFNKGHCGGNAGETLCASVVNLPLFPYMADEEIDQVLNTVRTALGR
jgi:dTDP-4-amino-4,6-dideoxygalactose transaminase